MSSLEAFIQSVLTAHTGVGDAVELLDCVLLVVRADAASTTATAVYPVTTQFNKEKEKTL